jgi:hypothetical protein
MPVAQSPAHYINSCKGCPSITESFPLVVVLVLCATVAALPVVQPQYISPDRPKGLAKRRENQNLIIQRPREGKVLCLTGR